MTYSPRATSLLALAACILVSVAGCGGGGGGSNPNANPVTPTPEPSRIVVASPPGPTDPNTATAVPAGFASVSAFVPAGQTQQDYALSNCETTLVEGTATTTTLSPFTAATLRFEASGDVVAVFSDASGESGVRIPPSTMEEVSVDSRVPTAARTTEQHLISLSFQYGENSGELSVDTLGTETAFRLVEYGTVTKLVACEFPAAALIRQSWPQPTSLRQYLQGVTAVDSTRTITSTLANGLLRWDNLTAMPSPGAPAQGPNRYLQVDLSTGVLSSAASSTATPSPIAWPSFPNTIAGFNYRVLERVALGRQTGIQIEVTPSATEPSWSMQMFRTNNSIQPVATQAAVGP